MTVRDAFVAAFFAFFGWLVLLWNIPRLAERPGRHFWRSTVTSNIRILLAQIATFEAQHKAGLNPPCSALAEFFDTARLARLDVEAFDKGLDERPLHAPLAPPPAPQGRDTGTVIHEGGWQREPTPALDRVDVGVVELTARVPLPVMARAVLDQLTVLDEQRLVRQAAPPRR